LPNFAEVVTPIRDIVGKKFDWYKQPNAEEALAKVYELLVKKGPFLHFPIKKVPLELATNASAHAIAGTLFQKVEGEVKILGYVSRVLKNAEKHYSIPKKEFIAVVYCILYFEEYLKYSTFKLHCDSKSVVSILGNVDKLKRSTIFAGWVARLSDFNFAIYHISGKDNVMADMASRLFCSYFTQH